MKRTQIGLLLGMCLASAANADSMFQKMGAQFDGAAMPKITDFSTNDEIVVGKCVSESTPTTLDDGMMMFHWDTDPVLGNSYFFGVYDSVTPPSDYARLLKLGRGEISLLAGDITVDETGRSWKVTHYDPPVVSEISLRTNRMPDDSIVFLAFESWEGGSAYCYFNTIVPAPSSHN